MVDGDVIQWWPHLGLVKWGLKWTKRVSLVTSVYLLAKENKSNKDYRRSPGVTDGAGGLAVATRAAFGAAPACPLGCPLRPGAGGASGGSWGTTPALCWGRGWDAQADGSFRVAQVLCLGFSPRGEFCSAPGLVPGGVCAGRGSPGPARAPLLSTPGPAASAPGPLPPRLSLCSPASPRCSVWPWHVARGLGAAPCKTRAAPASAFGR